MANMDPTPEEAVALTNAGAVLEWVGLADQANPQSAGASLLLLIGATATTPVRVLRSMAAIDWDLYH